MNHAAYYQAAVPEPHVILGLRLLPFSLGHRILLARIGSAFYSGGEVSYDDLASSVFICAHTWQENIASLQDPVGTGKFMHLWQKSIFGTGLLFSLGLKKPTTISIAEKAAAFRAYQKAGETFPDFKYEPGEALDCPIEQIVKATLLSKTNISEAELMDRSWSLCLWDYVTIKAIDGEVMFVDSAKYEAAQRQADAMHDRLIALHQAG
jgi:hypothetical protein